MKVRNQIHARVLRLARLAVTLTLALSLGACFSDSPLGPSSDTGAGSDSATEPAEATHYDVVVDLSHFKIVSDCDADPVIGDPNPGELAGGFWSGQTSYAP